MSSIFSRLKRRVAAGIRIVVGPYVATLKLEKRRDTIADDNDLLCKLDVQLVEVLRGRYEFLRELRLSNTPETASEILQCFYKIVAVLDPAAKEVVIRNSLHALMLQTLDPALKKQAILEIARSDLRSGIPDRAKLLVNDPKFRDELIRQIKASDHAYGANLLAQDWGTPSRGMALCYYFSSHSHLLEGKAILHISPEPELEHWIRSRGVAADYQTSNIAGQDVDMNQNLTCMTLEVDSYDFVICHRVLEHILDDQCALSELFRIVKPGGTLQISVPQSMHLENASEWVIPDESHHEHIRHYGSDFQRRLEIAGFKVEEVRWLLDQPAEELIENNAFPLRMYHATKPNRATI